MELKHHVQQALQGARAVPARRDYVVKDGEVIIVDEFTGRLMPGRRWSDGLHQAVEAKEGVKIERENQTLATITFQNYFRMYKKLAGMTGTAETEAAEFEKIYKLEVIGHSHQPAAASAWRMHDVVYRTEEEKFRNAAKEIKELHEKGQPVLVGTISVEKSEKLVGDPEEDGRAARGPERQESRARSRHRGAGGAQGRGHHLHQHGRPRYRHSARRQPRVHGQGRVPASRRSPSDPDDQASSSPTAVLLLQHREHLPRAATSGTRSSPTTRRRPTRSTTRWSRSAACTSWAPSGTNPAASTTSFAAAPAARAIPAARASTSRCKTT